MLCILVRKHESPHQLPSQLPAIWGVLCIDGNAGAWGDAVWVHVLVKEGSQRELGIQWKWKMEVEEDETRHHFAFTSPSVTQMNSHRKQLSQFLVHLSQGTGQGKDKVAIMQTKTSRRMPGGDWERKALSFCLVNERCLLQRVKARSSQARSWVCWWSWAIAAWVSWIYWRRTLCPGWLSSCWATLRRGWCGGSGHSDLGLGIVRKPQGS